MHDVVIVGAGPGGSATAAFLAKRGLDVLLLDKASFPREKTCGDGLTPRALQLLDELGLLKELYSVGKRIHNIAIHAPSGHNFHMPVPQRNGYPDHLLIIPRLVLDDRIRERALQAGASFQDSVRVKGITRDGHSVEVYGRRRNRPYRVKTRMAILATGANIKLLKDLGVLSETPRTLLAARAYFEDVKGLNDSVQARFDQIPLPGYGWVFPLSKSTANIGVGFLPGSWAFTQKPKTARQVFMDFTQSRAMQSMLKGAKQAGPLKGYPIRVDFTRAPTYGDGFLLVGEAAGLVSPLTGEGIDFALESGKIAADHVIRMLAAGDLSIQQSQAYDDHLRRDFQRLFLFLNRIQALYINPLLVNRVVRTAVRHPDLRRLLADIILGFEDAAKGLSWGVIRKVLFGF